MGRRRDLKFDALYGLYLSGLSLAQVGVEAGTTRQSIYGAFKKRGLLLRGPNFRAHQMYDGKKFTLRNTGYFSLTTGKRDLMHRYMWEKEVGKIPLGWDIHHKNTKKWDNRIENFECLPKSEHTRLYSPHNNQYTKGRKIEAHRTI